MFNLDRPVEKWQAQASTPVDPNISPELQRLRQDFLIEEPRTLSVKLAEFVVAPSASISTPIGFGANFGQIFGGFGFQSRTRFTNQADGGLALLITDEGIHLSTGQNL